MFLVLFDFKTEQEQTLSKSEKNLKEKRKKKRKFFSGTYITVLQCHKSLY